MDLKKDRHALGKRCEEEGIIHRRAPPGESQVKASAGAPPMFSLRRNWASGIPPINKLEATLAVSGISKGSIMPGRYQTLASAP